MSEPYQEHTVAIYIGVTGRLDQEQVLVEITKHGEAPNAWSYRAYNISGPLIKHYETKTVGHFALELDETVPPKFILGQFNNHWWRRVR